MSQYSEELEALFTPEGELQESFQVTDLSAANWAISKVAQAEARIQERQALADEYRRKIADWLEEANKPDVATVDRMSEMLRPWALTEVAKQKGKTVKLVDGRVGFRASQPSVVIDDPEEAMIFLKSFAPHAVRVHEEISKSEVKKLLKDGEEVPGVHVESRPEKFYVDVKGE